MAILCSFLLLYSAQLQNVNFGDKILSPGNCVERDAISLTASERERSCQGSKDVEENSHFVAGRSITAPLTPEESPPSPVFHALLDSTLYSGATIGLGTVSLVSGVGGALCQLTPWTKAFGDECLILSQTFKIAAVQSFGQALRKSPLYAFLAQKIPSSYTAWKRNQNTLSQIPLHSSDDEELMTFLQRRYLAKTTGIYPLFANWICPAFGVPIQVHPENTSSYARDPGNKLYQTYQNRMQEWKEILPQPREFPLILTKAGDISGYLPSCIQILDPKEISTALSQATPRSQWPYILDCTPLFDQTATSSTWQSQWSKCKEALIETCRQHNISLDHLLCFQRVEQGGIGGMRLLPLTQNEKHYKQLLEWISRFGLAANRVDLDRPLSTSREKPQLTYAPIQRPCQKEWLDALNAIHQRWQSDHPQNDLLFQATYQTVSDLIRLIPEEKWENALNSPTRIHAAKSAFSHIEKELAHLVEAKLTFHELSSALEVVHADMSILLEILSPFTREDFLTAFQRHLTCIPSSLLPLAHFGIHSSGMTSLAGIFHASKNTTATELRILFGENTYFECILSAELIGHATAINDATNEDWQEVDLILAQFNPVLKRVNSQVTTYQVTEYRQERIAQTLHRALAAPRQKPLTLALDGTLDFSNSTRVADLLEEFTPEIRRGDLNIICYRSGLKFDLFGMDNYCGAPFFMIHSQEQKWGPFDALLTDPLLQTDPLSLNWFALAYQNSACYLDAYRKQVFDNTRALLDKIPTSLYHPHNPRYRVIPVNASADTSFIDIKIFGPLHVWRASLMLGSFLTVQAMQAGHLLLQRPGIGFYHPNISVLFGPECSTIRLTLGLDPSQVDLFVDCFQKISALNL